jgi:hypothetical protein
MSGRVGGRGELEGSLTQRLLITQNKGCIFLPPAPERCLAHAPHTYNTCCFDPEPREEWMACRGARSQLPVLPSQLAAVAMLGKEFNPRALR